ncbi:conserved protein of unknown function [Ectopseudomonas oleovorans]|uniref:Uncharacterized protein n=1 Tax=Ectopseudomonas oleovorans TaxID=301 RepID=A0A653B538_ECTOL|nr:conserved protein of unknown function [Pseudomonas oleovorans]
MGKYCDYLFLNNFLRLNSKVSNQLIISLAFREFLEGWHQVIEQ